MNKRALVVDDDADIQTLLQTLLEADNYEVEIAANGQIALQKLEGGLHTDLLVLDLIMPDMTGYTLLNELYERGLHSSFAIIVISADVITRQQLVHLGAKGFLTKPFEITDLQNILKTL